MEQENNDQFEIPLLTLCQQMSANEDEFQDAESYV